MKITTKLDEYGTYEFNGNVDSIIDMLQKLKTQYQGYERLFFESYYYNEHDLVFKLFGEREATPEEVTAEAKKKLSIAEKEKQVKMELLERLKKELGV